MTLVVLAIFAALVAIAFVVAPLVRRPREGLGSAPGPMAPLGAEPDAPDHAPAASSALREELDLDRAMGKLGEDDYRRIRSELEGTPAPHDDGASTAGVAPGGSDAAAQAMISAAAAAARPTCPACGPRPEPAAAFCSRCGRVLAGCPSCGDALDEGALFCTGCGKRVHG